MASAFLCAALSAPMPASEEHHSFSHTIGMMANEAFSPHSAVTPHENHTMIHHMAKRSAMIVLQASTAIVQGVPNYLIAVVMILAVVLIFAFLWCAGPQLDRCPAAAMPAARAAAPVAVPCTIRCDPGRPRPASPAAAACRSPRFHPRPSFAQGLLLLHVPVRRRAPRRGRRQEAEKGPAHLVSGFPHEACGIIGHG